MNSPNLDLETRTAEEWRDAVYALERRGMLHYAYDTAIHALEYASCAEDEWLRHRAVLALARAGNTEAARWAFESLQLRDLMHESSVATLDARLKKDEALLSTGERRAKLLAKAASKYQEIHEREHDSYPAINAASLWLLAGDTDRAKAVAQEALDLANRAETDSALAEYFKVATVAEARLVLGDLDGARESIERAATLGVDDLSALATTARQLRLLTHALRVDEAILGPLRPPPVIHYSGHIIGPNARIPLEDEGVVREGIEHSLDKAGPAAGYGSLAAGADLLFAEALLERGADLTVVLPFAQDDFVRVSVAPSGPQWVERFETIYQQLDASNRVLYVTDDDYLGDDNLFAYADEFAMGLALLRARHIGADAAQVTVWDGEVTEGSAGTFAARRLWDQTGCGRFDVEWRSSKPPAPSKKNISPVQPGIERRRCALLFGDFKGFSKLPDRLLPAYVETVLGTAQQVIEQHSLALRNTWGDALYLVFDDISEAADCALDLQDAMTAIDWSSIGFETPLELRLGGHYGPVYRTWDPILDGLTYVGAHVSRAARVEPITPPGGFYVTEQFATKLALSHAAQFECEYVGLRDLPKNYGRLPLHLVRKRSAI